MDDRRFDSLAKSIASGSSRRSFFKGLAGVAGLAATGVLIRDRTDAARRGFSGPTIVRTPTPVPTPTCRRQGAPCDINDPAVCCSQICNSERGCG